MERREILRYTAFATGAAISLPLMTSLMSGCTSETASKAIGDDLHFFTKTEMSRLIELVDTILPKTDSPSASDVGVHKIIDSMVGVTYLEKDQKAYRSGFDALLMHLKGNTGAALGNEMVVLSSSTNDTLKKAFQDLKQQTIAYYLSTEEIGKNYLNYLPVPGEYEGCISLESVGGKAWAL